ncbi:uncharacterized protein [Dermacentor albipictus]|uniref:uncharacterized protein isoform X2 n=1 Tax=Dermacentor albipictus TaxID=60249 RepID=UPI0031FCAFC0
MRFKRLLRPRASPVPGATTIASTFPHQWRPAGRLDLPPRRALLVLHSRFQLRCASVPSVLLHDSTVCASKDYFDHEHHLFRERLLLLLHSLTSGVLLVDWTCLLAVHYWFCTPVQLWSTSVPSVLLHDSTVCASKDYFDHEHHLFRERLLLLLHSLTSCVLLVDWTCLLALHYWFCTPVQLRSTSVLSVLLHAYGRRSKRLLRPRASPVPGASWAASTFPRQWRPAGRLDLPPRPALLLESPVPGAAATASIFPRQWRLARRLDLSPRPALLLVLHSCFRLRWVPSTLLHVDYPVCAPKEITSGTSITVPCATAIASTFSRRRRPAGRLNLAWRPWT